MSTDRELLELAAKAAGLLSHRFCEPWNAMAAYTMQDGYYGPSWNPLTDDGDALRLAVNLRIEVDYYMADVQARHDDCDPVFELFSEHADHYAATRRAIVRAAAEIAKATGGAAPGNEEKKHE